MRIKNFLFLLFFLFPFLLNASMLIDDFENTDFNNLLNGTYITYNDGYSSININIVDNGYLKSKKCIKIDYELIEGALYPFAGVYSSFNKNLAPINLSEYKGIRFYAKGEGKCRVELASKKTDKEYNHYLTFIELSPGWQLYEIDFDDLLQTWGTPVKWDPTDIYAVQWTFTMPVPSKGIMYIDNIEFYKKSKKKILVNNNISLKIDKPKINQLGYLPDEIKYFTICADYANKGDIFKIIGIDGNTAFTDIIKSNIINDNESTGEKILIGDFSSFNKNGEYYIEINGKKSCKFKIGKFVYKNLFNDILRCYYLIRCNTEINDPITGIYHKACHMNDAEPEDKPGIERDLKGGWHNAGDYGKWTHMAAFSVSHMLWLFELKKDKLKNLNINIPESSNKISDVLDEALWGLNWLFKMQNNDGSIYHKVDTQPNFAIGKAPEDDPHKRYARFGSRGTQTPSTIDASFFVAVMCQAYRVFIDIDKSLADKCKKAAIKTIAWIEKNPKTAQDDIYYLDKDYYGELLWAYAEMYRLTDNNKYLNNFKNIFNNIPLNYPCWMDPQFLGYLTLYYYEKTEKKLKNEIINRIQNLADSYILKSNKSGYGIALDPKEYYWGSNQEVAGKAMVLIFSHIITGEKKYKDYALKHLYYLLGNNSLNKSFVTGYGANPVKYPYHWAYFAYKKIIPGWLTGGANQYIGSNIDFYLRSLILKGTPPAKCYADKCDFNGSWASNEGATDHQASFLFLIGFFAY